MKETKLLLLYLMLAVAVAYFFFFMGVFNWNEGERPGQYLRMALRWLIILAPCFFESVFNHSEDPVDFVLPVSTFEKYLHIMMRYLVIVPVTVLSLNQVFNLLLSLFPGLVMERFVEFSSLLDFSKDSLWSSSLCGGLFLLCAVFFRRNRVLWASGFYIGFTTYMYVTILVGLILFKLSIPEWESLGLSANNWGNIVQYSFVMPQQLAGVWIISNLAIHITWWTGILVSCYFILREREL